MKITISKSQWEKLGKVSQYTPSTFQSTNPEASDFMVSKDKASIPNGIKSKINNELHALGNYHTEIPLDAIFNICKKYGVVLLQEDGTIWSGMLLGKKPCGSEEARNQRVIFALGFLKDGKYCSTRNWIALSWCTMEGMKSEKYEIVCYLS